MGLRSSELAMLEWSDIDRDANVLQVRRKVTADEIAFVPKDKTDRFVPVSQAVWDALGALGDGKGGGYVVRLPRTVSRTDCFERTYLRRLKTLAPRTGIDADKLTLHNFRRFFVSHCAEVGIPMATVMEWVGHDEMGMVMHYYRMRDEFAQKAMQRFAVDLRDGVSVSQHVSSLEWAAPKQKPAEVRTKLP